MTIGNSSSNPHLNRTIDAIWNIINIVRKEDFGSDSYCVIFYFIYLKRYGFKFTLNEVYRSDIGLKLSEEIKVFNNGKGVVYTDLFSAFDPLIHNIDPAILANIIFVFNSLEFSKLESNISDLFDALIYLTYSTHRMGGEFILPHNVSKFVCELIELPDYAEIYNPFCGFATFGCLLKKDINYYAQEINRIIRALGTIRLILYNKYSDIHQGNSVTSWNPFWERESSLFYPSVQSQKRKFDLIITQPPFNYPINGKDIDSPGIVKSIEHFIIEQGLHDLKSNGKIVLISSYSFLFRAGKDSQLRKFLIEQDLIEMVLSFPDGLLYSSDIPFVIILINKEKVKKGVTLMVETSEFVEKKGRSKTFNYLSLLEILKKKTKSNSLIEITNSQVRDNNYDLNVSRYFLKNIKGEDITKVLYHYKPKRSAIPEFGKLCRIGNLKQDKTDYVIQVIDFDFEERLPSRVMEIKQSCLLIANKGNLLKPSFFKYENESLFITSDVSAFIVDEKHIDTSYLINELHSDYITEQLQCFRYGIAIRTLKDSDFLRIKILIPSLNEQIAKIKGINESIAEEKRKELILFNKINGLESELIEQNKYLRHTLAGPASNLEGSLKNINEILAKIAQSAIPDLFSLKTSEKHINTLGDYLKFLERDITKISETVRKQIKIENIFDDKEMSNIDIFEKLISLFHQYSDLYKNHFKIDFIYDPEFFEAGNGKFKKILVNGNVDLIQDLFDNVLENAIKHGFHNDNYDKFQVLLWLSDNNFDKKQYLSISFSNTGKQFPPDLTFDDYVRKGTKSGPSGGDGYGGWYINEIVKKHLGDLEIFDETKEGVLSEEFVTSIVVRFPINEILDDEEI